MTDTSGYLTTHVLDTARGVPAGGISIDLYRLEGERAPEDRPRGHERATAARIRR